MGIMGRPRIEFNDKDWARIDQLCLIQCTKDEICAIMDVSDDTLDKRIKEKHGVTFKVFFAQKSAGGKASLRADQFRMAKKNPTLSIWLGKQWLGQRDKHETEITSDIPIVLNYKLEE